MTFDSLGRCWWNNSEFDTIKPKGEPCRPFISLFLWPKFIVSFLILFFNLLSLKTIVNEQCYRIDPRKPGSAGAERRTGEESDPPGKEDPSSDGRTAPVSRRASCSSGEGGVVSFFEGFFVGDQHPYCLQHRLEPPHLSQCPHL